MTPAFFACISPSPSGGGRGWAHDGLPTATSPDTRPAPIPTFPLRGEEQARKP